MIHDAKVEVTCDGEGCRESIEIMLDYKYRSYSASSGFYDASDDSIEEKLAIENWTADDGSHYCESCAADKIEPYTEEREL